MSDLAVWCNTSMPDAALEQLRAGLGDHHLLLSREQTGNLGVSGHDPLLQEADIAFGQPDPVQVIALPRLKWVHLTTAGYTRYQREDLRQALAARGAFLTNSSMVYSETCSQHVVSFMLAQARRLPQAMLNQHAARGWPAAKLRIESRLLGGQTALLVGFGSIGRRVCEMLAPFRMNLIAVRRRPRGDEPIRCVPESLVDELLPAADHVLNILPASAQTDRYFDVSRLSRLKPSAIFYNIGRGSTVDQDALLAMLQAGRLAGAYLDVTEPEPLPPDHPLWTAPNCFITPHTAGGHDREFHSLVNHFLENLRRFLNREALLDRIM